MNKGDKAICANCDRELEWEPWYAYYGDPLLGEGWWSHVDGGKRYVRCDGKNWNVKEDRRWGEWSRPKKLDEAEAWHPDKVSPEKQLLLDAIDTINGERQDQYGNAEDSFAVIAEYWTTYVNRHTPDVDDWITITAKDVALMMTLFKVAREGNSPKRDNLLDGAGYLGLAHRIEVRGGENG